MTRSLISFAVLNLVILTMVGCSTHSAQIHNQTGSTIVFECALPSPLGPIAMSPSSWRYEAEIFSGETWNSLGGRRHRAGDQDWAYFNTGFRIRLRTPHAGLQGWINYRVERAGHAIITIRRGPDGFRVSALDAKGRELKVELVAEHELGNNMFKRRPR
jgi:hypothetical protein